MKSKWWTYVWGDLSGPIHIGRLSGSGCVFPSLELMTPGHTAQSGMLLNSQATTQSDRCSHISSHLVLLTWLRQQAVEG